MTPPSILGTPPLAALLHARRRIRRATGREFGMAHATRALARRIPAWQTLALEGPDGRPLLVDLREPADHLTCGWKALEHADPILSRLRDGDVVVDVGACIGVWSRAALARANLRALYAFEPGGGNGDLLDRNLVAYRQASYEPYAVGAEEREVQFTTSLGLGTNRVATDGAGPTRTVQMVTLNAWAARKEIRRIDVLKIDVEGHEPDVIRGGLATIAALRPAIWIELLPGAPRTALELLEGIGYRVSAVPGCDDYLAIHEGRP